MTDPRRDSRLDAARRRWAGEQARARAEGRPPDPRLSDAGERFWAALHPPPDALPITAGLALLVLVLAAALLARGIM